MDNVTHTLVGVLVGATIAELTKANPSRLDPAEKRLAVIAASAVGSNLPDSDLLYSALGQGKLGYLLEHRGYTHTVLGGLVCALALWGLCEAYWRYRGRAPSTSDRSTIALAAVGTVLLHIAMDFTNSYGVHPFWPLDNHWYYGDFIFIAEPGIWVAMTPLVFVLVSRGARTAVAVLLLAGIAIAGIVGVVAWKLLIVLLIAMALLAYMSRKVSKLAALAVSIVVWLSVTAAFAIAGRAAQHRMNAAMASVAPESKVLDVILTPSPANPLCWEAIVVSRTEKSYALRNAQLSLAPSWLPPEKCRRTSPIDGITAPLEKVQGPPAAGIKWQGEYVASIADLKGLVDSYCQVAALMRFVRAPFFVHNAATLVGDLRYDREPALGFAEVSLENLPARCSLHIPPWEPPREDLLASH